MKSLAKESIDNLLGSVKLRRTGPRRTILEVLLSAKRPQTVDEIMTAMSRRCANKVTVYRTLESMVGAGLVHRAFVHKRAEHFELADRCTGAQYHPHFTCVSCGVTNCVAGVSIPIVKGLEEGFIIHRQQVHLEGLCPRCV
ncbi:MAG: transcriptional repressor [Sedimentisphaerales bacterium]|nr:transcriptional repressor [Sedimentisphaerales bacterium]